ncbi:MAG: glycoside hydrolase family 32 protein [Saprospiraceae bacterium]|nr:glycoside hydrolase family 32 protein [Saprospiraceae bacterium]
MQCQDMSNETETMAAPELYQERHRPQVHFSPKEKWMNDPNGMVFFEGEYHLFYQYYPDSTIWGPMHWGHAISKDLVHWEHLPIALYPDSLGYIFSGSAVVDWNNTSGLGSEGAPPLIAIFTYHDVEGERANTDTFQSQAIAYSNDRGRTWTKYEGNPVIPNPGIRDFRDPKVIWDANSEQWVMVFAAQDRVKIYGSKNLKDWEHLSDFGENFGDHGGVWECPDLFPLYLAEEDKTYWVLLLSINPGGPNGGSATQYFIGDFDGQQFILDDRFQPYVKKKETGEEQAVWVDYGRDNYAGVTWSDIPKEDGRRIFIGWMSNWDYAKVVPTEVWRSAMTLPRTLTLVASAAGPRLQQAWVEEVDALAMEVQEKKSETVQDTINLIKLTPGESVVARLKLRVRSISQGITSFGIMLVNAEKEYYLLGYNVAKKHFFSNRTSAGDHSFSDKFAEAIHIAPYELVGDEMDLDIVIDRSSVELLAANGTVALTDLVFPKADFHHLVFFTDDGSAEVAGTITPLRSIW